LNFKWFAGYVVPVPNNWEKLLASLLYGGSIDGQTSPRVTLTRMLGIRIETFFLTSWRSLLDKWITRMFFEFRSTLEIAPPKDQLSLSEMQTINRDYSQVLDLYLGLSLRHELQGGGPVIKFCESHIRDLN